jgi:DNA-binding CsgD family transcriptional regulator
MCSPALSFVLVDQSSMSSLTAHEKLALLMPHLQGTLVRVLKFERREHSAASMAALSICEREILRQIARGKTDEEIARTTNRSVHTVKNQVRQMLERFGFVNRVQAVAAGFAASIFGPAVSVEDASNKKNKSE